jgi:hypothetical protein
MSVKTDLLGSSGQAPDVGDSSVGRSSSDWVCFDGECQHGMAVEARLSCGFQKTDVVCWDWSIGVLHCIVNTQAG